MAASAVISNGLFHTYRTRQVVKSIFGEAGITEPGSNTLQGLKERVLKRINLGVLEVPIRQGLGYMQNGGKDSIKAPKLANNP